MISIIIFYVIGRQFYKLAEDFDKHKWGYAFLGIIGYYVGTFIGGLLVVGVELIMGESYVDWDNTLVTMAIALPFGIASCYFLHKILEKKWLKQRELEAVSIDDIGSDLVD